jgi:hypothetical protein
MLIYLYSLTYVRIPTTKQDKLGVVAHLCNPTIQEVEIRRIAIQNQTW